MLQFCVFLGLLSNLFYVPGEDFTLPNLMAWSTLLRSPYQGPVVSPDIISNSQRLIGDEEKVDDVALQWNVNVVKGPLRAAAAKMLNDDPNRVTVAKRQHCFPNPTKTTVARKNDLKPDMTVHISPKNDHSLATMLVMGDNKYSGAWDFEQSWKVIQQRGKKNMDMSMRPFRQIATYCMVGKTRYGYIMSDRELLAVRVYCNKDKAGVAHWGVEISHPIPWDASPRCLTVNLAIWWLGVMAMNESERSIKSRSKTPRINGWYENQGGDGKVQSYTHILSRNTLAAGKKPTRDPVYPRGL